MTDIDIVNKALLKLGQAPVTSLAEDNERAFAANCIYESVRDFVMSSYRWNFAVKRIALMPCEEKPDFGFAFKYHLPPYFLRLLSLPDAPDNATDDYSIEGGFLLTDYSAPLNVIYLAKITDTELYPVYFVETLACKLAFELCERLKQDPSRKNTLMQEYMFSISQAKKCNAIQMAAQRMPVSKLISTRFGY